MTTGERRDQIRGREIRLQEILAALAGGGYGVVGNISTIDPDDAASAGVLTTLARADHQHAITAAAPGTIAPDDTAAEGSASSFARSDHRHAITAGTPASISHTNAEGAGTEFARNNHVHGIAVPAVRAVWSANTSIPNDGSAAIAFGGTDEYDTDTMHNPVTNNTRITFSTAGVYYVGGWFTMAADADGARGIAIRRNATTDIAVHNKVTAVFGGAGNDTMAISTEFKFAAADFIELIAFNVAAGVALNVTGGAFWASYRTAG